MSSSAEVAVINYAFEVAAGTRWTLFMLAHMCEDGRDGSWSCTAAVEDIGQRTGWGGSTTRRHLDWLAERGWLAKRPTWRADGGRDVTRYVLNPDMLDPDETHRSKWARGGVRRGDNLAEPVGGAVDESGEHVSGDQSEQGPPPELSALIEDSPSFLPSFFKTTDDIEWALRILAVCGQGLGPWRTDEQIARSLSRLMPDWRRDYDLDKDILPVIAEQTAHKRRRVVVNFVVFEPDLDRHKRNRLKFTQRLARDGLA